MSMFELELGFNFVLMFRFWVSKQKTLKFKFGLIFYFVIMFDFFKVIIKINKKKFDFLIFACKNFLKLVLDLSIVESKVKKQPNLKNVGFWML